MDSKIASRRLILRSLQNPDEFVMLRTAVPRWARRLARFSDGRNWLGRRFTL